MPTCAAHGCVNTTGRLKEKKSFFRIPRPVKESEKKRAAKWLHNMGMGQNVKTYVFGQDKVLCQDHFHPSCLKEDMRAKILGYKPKKEKQELLPGSLPTIFKYKIFDQINMDGTKVMSRGTSLKRTQEMEREEVRRV